MTVFSIILKTSKSMSASASASTNANAFDNTYVDGVKIGGADVDYYTILGLTPDATTKQIRNAYKILARIYHPDRRKSLMLMIERSSASNPQQDDPDTLNVDSSFNNSMNGVDADDENGKQMKTYLGQMGGLPDGVKSFDEMFSLISQAYEVLGDQTKRTEYDLLQQLTSNRNKEHNNNSSSSYSGNGYNNNCNSGDIMSKDGKDGFLRLRSLHREDAERAVELMEHTFDLNRMNELSQNGLLIDDAWFGDSTYIENLSTVIQNPNIMDLPIINVTRQLQCQVNNSKIVFITGDSMILLSGFYDPCPDTQKKLYVRYYFRGKRHEVVIDDKQKLLLPLKSHLVTSSNRVMNSDISIAISAKQETRAIRRYSTMFSRIFTLVALGVGLTFLTTMDANQFMRVLKHPSSLPRPSFSFVSSIRNINFSNSFLGRE